MTDDDDESESARRARLAREFADGPGGWLCIALGLALLVAIAYSMLTERPGQVRQLCAVPSLPATCGSVAPWGRP